MVSRRQLLAGSLGTLAAAARSSEASGKSNGEKLARGCQSEILGQGKFRYKVNRLWGVLDPAHYPVRDCHGIAQDRAGRIVLLTNETRNNLLAYEMTGSLFRAWESRFPGAHGLDIVERQGESQYWITDRTRQVVSVCTQEGRELLRVGPEALSAQYSDLTKYHPTNTATLPDGDFFVTDGYGSSFVHHFDPKGRYISSFGGKGDAPA